MSEREHTPIPLGERAVEIAILSLVNEAGIGTSVSPADVALALGPDWRAKLSAVKRAAIRLAKAGQIDILRKGKPVPVDDARGVIRLSLPHAATAPSSTEI